MNKLHEKYIELNFKNERRKNFFKRAFRTVFYFINLIIILISIVLLPTYAYEDCIITTDGSMSDIKIQYNDIIDVFPLVTIMNEKNTLIVHPLKEGGTKFSILKNKKDKIIFNVKVQQNKTTIDNVEDFEILTIDYPPTEEYFDYDFELDEPPIFKGGN